MKVIERDSVLLHVRESGDRWGQPVVFANSLGTDYRLWDAVLPLLPEGLRIIRFDKRGHGLSSCPGDSWSMNELIDDCAHILRELEVSSCFFVGLSIGGLIAQGLAAKHRTLLDAMVISNTAARIGTEAMWQERIDAVQTGGIEALADAVLDRWFSRDFHTSRGAELQLWRNMLTRTPDNGYIGCSRAIAGADFTDSNATLKLPTLAIAGDEDGSTPPDVVRATAEGIAGAQFALVEGAGHLPCVEKPQIYAGLLVDFMRHSGWLAAN